jgi:hypothetical protein
MGKKEAPHVVYQPYPMVVPYMMPQSSYQSIDPSMNPTIPMSDQYNQSKYFSRSRISNSLNRSQKLTSLKSFKPLKLTYLTRIFRIGVSAVIFLIRLRKFCEKIIKFRR